MSSVNLAFSTLKKFCVLVPVIGDGVSFSSTDIVMPVRNNVCTVTQKSFFLLCFYSIQGTDLNYTYKNLSPCVWNNQRVFIAMSVLAEPFRYKKRL